MVKILNALLGPKVREMIQNVINADIPVSGLGWLTGYLAMLLGALLTILVQEYEILYFKYLLFLFFPNIFCVFKIGLPYQFKSISDSFNCSNHHILI